MMFQALRIALAATVISASMTATAEMTKPYPVPGQGPQNGGYNPNPGPQYPNYPGNGGGGYNPGGPRNPHPNPPYPPPGPQPTRTVIGEIRTITDSGEILGWACDTTTRAPLNLSLYINGYRARVRAQADQSTRGDSRMGWPDRLCGEFSGFRLQVPQEMFDGNTVTVEVRGYDMRSNMEVSFDSAKSFRTPMYRIGQTLFQVGNGPNVYYSNGQDAFCLIANPDQLRLFYKDGVRITHNLPMLPSAMRNDGTCAIRPYPKSLFTAVTTGQTVYFSNGQNAFCGIPFPGMLNHLAAAVGLSPRQIDKYEGLPQNMSNDGICKVEGFFSLGPDVYYSNGQNAFCHVTNPGQIGGKPVYPYEGFPPGMANHGDCR